MLRLQNLLFVFLLLSSCGAKKIAIAPPVDQMKELKSLMTGSFDSSQQAKEDSTYFDISLHMYPIWENRDGYYPNFLLANGTRLPSSMVLMRKS